MKEHLRDLAFFAGLLGFVALSGAVIGVSLSTIQQVKTRQCPVISGYVPVSTIHNKDGQFCQYVKPSDLHGRVTYKVEL